MAFTYPYSNTYIGETEADNYNIGELNRDEWGNLTSDEKNAALVNATVFLDKAYDWKGRISDEGNAHAWPRKNVTDNEGREVPSDTIPVRIKRATAEAAYIDAVEGGLIPTESNADLDSLSAGSVSLDFGTSGSPSAETTKVDRIVKGLYVSKIGGNNVGVTRT